jgi:hypothetical protein
VEGFKYLAFFVLRPWELEESVRHLIDTRCSSAQKHCNKPQPACCTKSFVINYLWEVSSVNQRYLYVLHSYRRTEMWICRAIRITSCLQTLFFKLVVRVPGYRSRGPGSISCAIRFSEKYWVWNGVRSASWVQLRSYLIEKTAVLI